MGLDEKGGLPLLPSSVKMTQEELKLIYGGGKFIFWCCLFQPLFTDPTVTFTINGNFSPTFVYTTTL